jgi:hypothetical protein
MSQLHSHDEDDYREPHPEAIHTFFHLAFQTSPLSLLWPFPNLATHTHPMQKANAGLSGTFIMPSRSRSIGPGVARGSTPRRPADYPLKSRRADARAHCAWPMGRRSALPAPPPKRNEARGTEHEARRGTDAERNKADPLGRLRQNTRSSMLRELSFVSSCCDCASRASANGLRELLMLGESRVIAHEDPPHHPREGPSGDVIPSGSSCLRDVFPGVLTFGLRLAYGRSSQAFHPLTSDSLAHFQKQKPSGKASPSMNILPAFPVAFAPSSPFSFSCRRESRRGIMPRTRLPGDIIEEIETPPWQLGFPLEILSDGSQLSAAPCHCKARHHEGRQCRP